jgi:RHS repeat-associated protein
VRLGNESLLLSSGRLVSIINTTNSSGAITLSRQYDTYGNLQTGATTAGYAFTGREWDPETNLYYYRARYYDPTAGRFLSEDPLPLTERRFRETNAYVYVANNPVNFTDPDGLSVNTWGNWCGPGPYTARGKKNSPVNRIDACCKVHDECYDRAGASAVDNIKKMAGKPMPPAKQKCVKDCDTDMCHCMNKVMFQQPTTDEITGAAIFSAFFNCK